MSEKVKKKDSESEFREVIGKIRGSVEAVNDVLDQLSKDYIIISNEYEKVAEMGARWAAATGAVQLKQD